jgi:hypothetical protein
MRRRLASENGCSPSLPLHCVSGLEWRRLRLIPTNREDPMKKVKLMIEELEVSSFETETKDDGRGTIAAHGLSGFTCPACPTVPTRYGTCCTP